MQITSLSTHMPQMRGNDHRLCLHDFSYVGNEFVYADSLQTVPPNLLTRYSQFKYGVDDVAEQFATDLAAMLRAHLAPVLGTGEQIVVTGTPYKKLPNAARMLAFTTERLLRAAGLPTAYTYIYQHRLAEGDYGVLSNADRDLRNNQKERYLSPSDFAGKHVVLIDDVRVTGSIEQSVLAMLAGIEVLSVTVVNLIRLDPVIAEEQPRLEDKLNHYFVRNISYLLDLMEKRDNFTLTTRAVKYILESDPQEVRWLVNRLDAKSIAKIYEGIVEDGYDQMMRYAPKFKLVCSARNS
jgi:hypothetical protein